MNSAHARIAAIDASAARALPGVIAVLTGADMAPLTKVLRPDLPVQGVQVTHGGEEHGLPRPHDRRRQ
jgi:CO/xanthine dehydrogenase Mo-binding subunit